MALTKQAITLRMEAKELAATAVPSPTTFFDWASAIGGVTYAIGTQRSVDIFGDIKAEIADRVANGVSALPREDIRAYWIGHMCWPYMRWWGETLAELGVNVVAANYTHMGFIHRPDLIDPAKPMESLAANSICVLSYGVEPLAEQIIDQCRRYKLDAIVCHLTRTCRIFPGPYFAVMDIVERELGIPAVFFEGDVADGNFFSPEQARTRLGALRESILARRAALA
jgi:benzoyl-CoA reductase/2-hydroxyglutaryl-CoA dehydratase subunit BcrC/BadD/HgdB